MIQLQKQIQMKTRNLGWVVNKMYKYNIHKNADEEKFNSVCNKIESTVEGLHKEETIMEVDGSAIQIYKKNGKSIKVFNDYEVDAVYIDSEINIDDIVA